MCDIILLQFDSTYLKISISYFRYCCYIPERHLPCSCTYGVSRIFPMWPEVRVNVYV